MILCGARPSSRKHSAVEIVLAFQDYNHGVTQCLNQNNIGCSFPPINMDINTLSVLIKMVLSVLLWVNKRTGGAGFARVKF